MLKLELKPAIKELKKIKAKRVFLQVPEGLKVKVEDIMSELESNGFIVFASMDPCFGACDLKQSEAKRMNCDTILHIGHTKFLEKTSIPTVYAPLKYDLGERFGKIIETLSEWLKGENIKEAGIVTTAQYLEYVEEIKKELQKKGIKIEIEKGKRVERAQILGCNYSSADVKAKTIIYFGDGLFHPLGIHFATQKKVIIANPISLEISALEDEKNKFLKQRILLIERAKEAKSYAIIVSTKEGQNRISEAEKIKKALEKNGKKANIYLMDFISNESLLGIKAEALINTACPRIGIDDYLNYKLPIINKNEVDYLLGKSYDDYKIDYVY